ncbi:MAG: hypothetical protein OXU81_23120 [Gammaproteobacteria bacterium]|nr:hypothetical protein [Gammaproteobacteria bacterium]
MRRGAGRRITADQRALIGDWAEEAELQCDFALGHVEVDEQVGGKVFPKELKRNLILISRRVSGIRKLIDTGEIMERPADEYSEGSLDEADFTDGPVEPYPVCEW